MSTLATVPWLRVLITGYYTTNLFPNDPTATCPYLKPASRKSRPLFQENEMDSSACWLQASPMRASAPPGAKGLECSQEVGVLRTSKLHATAKSAFARSSARVFFQKTALTPLTRRPLHRLALAQAPQAPVQGAQRPRRP